MKLAFEIKVLKKVAPELSPRYFLGSATVRMRAPSSHRQVTPPAPGVAAGCSCTQGRAPASTEGTPFRSWERGGFVRTGPSGARHVLEVKGCFGGAAVLLWSRARVIPRISGLMFTCTLLQFSPRCCCTPSFLHPQSKFVFIFPPFSSRFMLFLFKY